MANDVNVTIRLRVDDTGALNVVKQTMRGVKTSVDEVNKSQTIGGNINNNLAKTVGQLDTTWGKYRSTLGLNLRQANAFTNQTFELIRVLGRLRTIFFLLITVFAVRPTIRIFEEFAKASTNWELIFARLTERFDIIKGKVGDKLAPVFREIVVLVELLKLKIVELGIIVLPVLVEIAVAAVKVNHAMTLVTDEIALAIAKFQQWIGISDRQFHGAANLSEIEQDVKDFTAGLKKVEELKQLMIWGEKKPGVTPVEDPNIGMKFWIQNDKKLIDEWIKEYSDALTKAQEKLANAKGEFTEANKQAVKELADQVKIAETVLAQDQAVNVEDIPAMKRLRALQTTLRSTDFDEIFAEANAQLGKEGGETSIYKWGLAGAEEWQRGFETGFNKFKLTLTADVDKLAQDTAQGIQTGLGDTFLNIMQRKFNKFKDIVVNTLTSIQKAIADFLARRATGALLEGILGPIAKGITGYFGGSSDVVTGNAAGNHAASGNIVYNPSVSQVGESGPEAIVPLQYLQGTRKSGTTVVFNISAIDGPSTDNWFRANKEKVIGIMTEAINGGNQGVRHSFAHR